MLAFPHFTLSDFRFHLGLPDDVRLPAYRGFTLRGVFGRMLKKTVCAIRTTPCQKCMLNSRCVYCYLFETRPVGTHPHAGKFTDHPRPYIINPEPGRERLLHAGDELSFRLTLVGRAGDYLPYIVYCFEEAGKQGIKNRIGRYAIRNVEMLNDENQPAEVYRDGMLKNHNGPITFRDLSRDLSETRNLTIRFRTPLRIEVKGHLVHNPPPFAVLIESLLRRASLLHHLHCGGDYLESFDDVLDQARRVTITSARVRWQDMERYSSRQKTLMYQGGIVGSVRYEGDITPFLPILRLGEFINVGASTTVGLGRYSLHHG
ncbi:MAG: CRISPR system precrRNA processing endoribonuclease RAMP protein Cas6 [Syntrophorhabdus aromaticivorans]|uniref:CRISPR system precrRNA processing endoribonuclease RAMP protein Cas6 n=1 Tax=Syntrophorhabdus aromaticivorans TaxID=328301 RepID=A0A971M633_9BACT|nr:CRISPR system precrRNA processing endoribonuclease RAMP protein Cas6 [Syntrophorhabdus aromaticivorans]